ncbi:MAG: glycosyltransferase [Deltaproteobacteria bacterium]|nr:glycosyltransferase [Deltaproteobacteria bacterium]
MRVAHVMASYEMGGGEMVALRLARQQKKDGWPVMALGLSATGPLRARFAEAEIPAEVVAKGDAFDGSLFVRLALHFWRRRVELVHTHNPQALIYAAPAARLVGAKVVHTKHGEAMDLGRRMWLRRGAARFVHAFVSVSERTESFAREQKEAPLARLAVIDNGVDIERYAPTKERRAQARKRLGFAEGVPVVGSVGRLQEVKDHALLLRAVARCPNATQLVLVGDGPERGPLTELAEALGIAPRVHLLGHRDDVEDLYPAFDLFAMSSRTEGLPLVMVEAMASEVAVVSTAVGGIPAVLGEGVGELVPAGDEEALANTLQALLADVVRRKRLALAGRARVLERYSLQKMAQRYADLYARL